MPDSQPLEAGIAGSAMPDVVNNPLTAIAGILSA